MPLHNKEFTLIKLIIVATTIGNLAALNILVYQNFTAHTRVSEAINLATGAKSHVVETHIAIRKPPTNHAIYGLTTTTTTSNNISQLLVVESSLSMSILPMV